MKIAIIGGGACGLMAAIAAAEQKAGVTVFEKNNRIGKKILATGNGKCNFSNLDFHMGMYYCKDKSKLEDFFHKFSCQDMIRFLEKNGILIRERNGYLYPYTEQAATIRDVLERNIEKYHVRVRYETEITEICFHQRKQQFLVRNENKEEMFDRLILACGSPASLKRGMDFYGYRLAKSFGHHLNPVVPALVQLRCSDSFLKEAAGVRTKARIALFADGRRLAEEEGELQFTDYGISGIPVFQFSRVAGYALLEKRKVTAEINLLPEFTEEAFEEMVIDRYEKLNGYKISDFVLGLTNSKLNGAILHLQGLKKELEIKEIGLSGTRKLMSCYRKLTVHIEQPNGIEHAQVCAGGIPLEEVSEKLESLKQKGLYLAGELLDVDGKCGGYNLQFAWTSGVIAGRNAAREG